MVSLFLLSYDSSTRFKLILGLLCHLPQAAVGGDFRQQCFIFFLSFFLFFPSLPIFVPPVVVISSFLSGVPFQICTRSMTSSSSSEPRSMTLSSSSELRCMTPNLHSFQFLLIMEFLFICLCIYFHWWNFAFVLLT